jgi:hypothetical protein
VIKLLTIWAAFRLLRAVAAILVIATLALLLVSGVRRTAGQGDTAGRLQHAAHPIEQQWQQVLRKAIGP